MQPHQKTGRGIYRILCPFLRKISILELSLISS